MTVPGSAGVVERIGGDSVIEACADDAIEAGGSDSVTITGGVVAMGADDLNTTGGGGEVAMDAEGATKTGSAGGTIDGYRKRYYKWRRRRSDGPRRRY